MSVSARERLVAALGQLQQLPLWDAGQAADLLWLHFGRKVTKVNRKGESREVGELAVHVQCEWGLVSSNAQVLTSSNDATADATLALRRWISATAPVVSTVETSLPSLHLRFHNGHRLEVTPTTLDGLAECWRVLPLARGGEHGVVTIRTVVWE